MKSPIRLLITGIICLHETLHAALTPQNLNIMQEIELHEEDAMNNRKIFCLEACQRMAKDSFHNLILVTLSPPLAVILHFPDGTENYCSTGMKNPASLSCLTNPILLFTLFCSSFLFKFYDESNSPISSHDDALLLRWLENVQGGGKEKKESKLEIPLQH